MLNGLTMLNCPYYTQNFVKGAVLVGALALIPAALIFDTSKVRAKRRHQPPPRPSARDTSDPLPGPLALT